MSEAIDKADKTLTALERVLHDLRGAGEHENVTLPLSLVRDAYFLGCDALGELQAVREELGSADARADALQGEVEHLYDLVSAWEDRHSALEEDKRLLQSAHDK